MMNTLKRFVWLSFKLFIGFLILSNLLVLLFKRLDPPSTSFIIQAHLSSIMDKSLPTPKSNWVDYDKISNRIKMAIIASEDQKFPVHNGFDFEAIALAYQYNKKGKAVKGASTITQQLAKNLFLWKRRSYFRKAVEAYFTLLIELYWDKKRILEVYLNTAEMGPNIFGIKEAAIYHFKKPQKKLTSYQAAQLAAILPNPKIYRVKRPSRQTIKKVKWIRRQVKKLGGLSYINKLL